MHVMALNCSEYQANVISTTLLIASHLFCYCCCFYYAEVAKDIRTILRQPASEVSRDVTVSYREREFRTSLFLQSPRSSALS